MSDSTTSGPDAETAGSRPRVKRRIRSLEQRLAKTRAKEARRAARLEQARASGASPKIEQRRTRKVERARARGEHLEAAIAKLRPTASSSAEPVFAYCLRDRERVAMEDPQPITMRNGRGALAGRCPRCGQRLVRPVAAHRDTATGPG